MKDYFLILIDFENKNFFTLVGGLKTTSIDVMRESVETVDFARDWRFYIEKSGVRKVNVQGNGVVDPDLPKRLIDELLISSRDGIFLKCKIENDKNTIEGSFLPSISLSDDYDDSLNFDLKLESAGEIAIK